MHVRVRFFGKPDTIVVVESKLTKIEQFRRIIKEKFGVEPKSQRLFYGGKVLENGYTFHDYNIKLNDVVQLMVKCPEDNVQKEEIKEELKFSVPKESEEKKVEYKDVTSTLFEVGDLVDVRTRDEGSWFEAKIIRIVLDPNVADIPRDTCEYDKNDVENQPPGNSKKKGIEKFFAKQMKDKFKTNIIRQEEHLLFKVHFEEFEDDSDQFCKLKEIRPRARNSIDIKDVKPGWMVMINHNINKSSEKGFWYDFKVEEVKKGRRGYELVGTLYLGQDAIPQNDTKVPIHDKIFAIEEIVPLAKRSEEYKKLISNPPEPRSKPLRCTACRDDEDVNCKECGCYICYGKESPDEIILCDECNYGFHMKCLDPPLKELPEEDWYCPSCKRDTNEVVAPGAAKQIKKNSKSNRDWGRGMACVGKTRTCAMPANHFGPIPGIEVGMCWRFRIQLSESGVHRPPVSGIHGRDVEGAYSIVLGGGYEDDYDNGYEFTYTGSGGRDLSGNKRTAEQSCDQTLTRENKALARNCAVKVISESGGDAGDDWKQGKPVRVVRSYKMMKHFPKYAPKEGIRYDGIYKVVKYYPEKGLSGYQVWKYLLRRDDPNPAPWEAGANQYPIIYPDGYLEAEAEKKALKEKSKKGKPKKRTKENDSSDSDSSRPTKKRKVKENVTTKRTLKENNCLKEEERKTKKVRTSDSESKEGDKSASVPSSPKIPDIFKKAARSPKSKENATGLTSEELAVIKSDSLNTKLWNECVDIYKEHGKKEFIEHVTQVFLCIICQDVTVSPVTTPCLHNFCMACLKLAFKSTDCQQCPCCRHNLSKMELTPNENLKTALRTILAGYDAGKK
ncbi:unnamed protein product [Pieris macdunnoughi]|uniref:RING-type E3 ubiquitin transferase n=1 Tax=Pieris macdunnoughi TaxID=345717 RepID=A0A821L2Q0_9NEOP|nr:unnamed protein product [Pieris macdunnoughi]